MANLTILKRKEYEEYSEPAVIERSLKSNYVDKYESPKNELTKKTTSYLSVWEAEELNLDMPLSKTLYLAQWVSNSIKSNVGNYVNTEDLYQNYKDHTLRGAHLPQRTFSKQLESAMNSFNIKPSRSRFKKRRGYLGIECIDLPLSSEEQI